MRDYKKPSLKRLGEYLIQIMRETQLPIPPATHFLFAELTYSFVNDDITYKCLQNWTKYMGRHLQEEFANNVICVRKHASVSATLEGDALSVVIDLNKDIKSDEELRKFYKGCVMFHELTLISEENFIAIQNQIGDRLDISLTIQA